MSVVVQYTETGEPHGLINVMTNSVEWNDFKHMKPEIKAKLEKEKKEDARIVKAQVLAKRQHDRLEKIYCRYAGDPIQQWKLIPGRTYELPMGFIKEVNEKVKPKRSGLLSQDGKNVTADGSPLAKDETEDWDYKLVPIGFF